MEIIKNLNIAFKQYQDNNEKFYSAIEAALNDLLLKTGQYNGTRSVDGLIFEYVNFAEKFNAIGIAVMIEDQSVEPIKINTEFENYDLAKLDIYFGIKKSPKIYYGSKEHNKIKKQIIADLNAEFDWKHHFSFCRNCN